MRVLGAEKDIIDVIDGATPENHVLSIIASQESTPIHRARQQGVETVPHIRCVLQEIYVVVPTYTLIILLGESIR